MKKLTRRVAPLITLVALVLMATVPVALAVENPELIAGNPTCTDIGLLELTRFDDGPGDGTHTQAGATITVNGGYVDWSSPTTPIDAVIVKASPAANVYRYDEATSGTGLVTPINTRNDQPHDVSHVSLCYDVAPVVVEEEIIEEDPDLDEEIIEEDPELEVVEDKDDEVLVEDDTEIDDDNEGGETIVLADRYVRAAPAALATTGQPLKDVAVLGLLILMLGALALTLSKRDSRSVRD